VVWLWKGWLEVTLRSWRVQVVLGGTPAQPGLVGDPAGRVDMGTY